MPNYLHSGFVALIGRTNAGKSTFLNAVIGSKIAIVTHKPQTKRNALRGILSTNEGQMVLVDTPGIHKPETSLDEEMNREAFHAMKEADVIFWIIDASKAIGKGDNFVKEQITSLKNPHPVFLLLNKMDLLNNEQKASILTQAQELMTFEDIIFVSSLENTNIEEAINKAMVLLPEGPAWYPVEHTTDQTEQFIIAEYVREKILLLTQEEVPYSCAVVVQNVESDDEQDDDEELNNDVYVRCVIVVERDSQKGIIIGEKGAMISKIRHQAERDCKRFLGKAIKLELFVKVIKDWRNRPEKLKSLGYNR